MSLGIDDETEFISWVNSAFKDYDSVLALARSPLANSPLITPLLVLDDVSPNAEQRGQALRLMLRWAVERLAPEPPDHPLGSERPFDDPSWRAPRWWRYNILRHRYLEPLHPDDFVEHGRFTETLIALTGIPSNDTFFEERNRAIREASHWLRQQWLSGQANHQLQGLALVEVYRLLQQHSAAEPLLEIAAIFDDVFPRHLLRQMAVEERIDQVDEALDFLIQRRFLVTGDNGSQLSISSVLRQDLYARLSPAKIQRRHRRAANYYLSCANNLRSVAHLQKAAQWHEAATTLLAAVDELVNEMHTKEVTGLLQAFDARHLAREQWREIQIRLSDLLALTGAHEGAAAACRRALKAAETPTQQARIYRRLGKLFEFHNQLHALNYYQQAVERFELDDPELVDLLKDRAWLYILRQAWEPAERDLNLALARVPSDAPTQRANIYDALSYLFGRRQQYTTAVQYAQQALTLREESGDILRMANSFVMLGLLYMYMGEYANALAAHHDGLKIYRQLDNHPKVASTLSNIGMVYHLDRRLEAAVTSYLECLTICRQIGSPLIESRVSSNLAEAYTELEQTKEAQHYWQTGLALARTQGFAEEVAYYEELSAKFPILQTLEQPSPDTIVTFDASQPTVERQTLTSDEEAVLRFAQRSGQVTASQLIEEAHLSRATATRRLAGLVEKGYLQPHGKGRGAYYRLVELPKSKSTPTLPIPSHISADQIRAALQKHRQDLHQRFSVAALGLPDHSEPILPASQMIVRFTKPPDLQRYFELKRHLGELLQMEVDLLPEMTLSSASPGRSFGAVQWVWQ